MRIYLDLLRNELQEFLQKTLPV